jgi:hypothetical protein
LKPSHTAKASYSSVPMITRCARCTPWIIKRSWLVTASNQPAHVNHGATLTTRNHCRLVHLPNIFRTPSKEGKTRSIVTMTINNSTEAAASYSFEEYWARSQAKKAAELAEKFSSIKAAFDGLKSKEEIQLLCKVIHPDQQVIVFEKTGSSQVSDTDGLPCYADREPYSTVRRGLVYYFHASTLKEGATVEYNNKLWRVMMNYLARGSASSLAYQCIYLLEIADVFKPQE